MVTRGGALSVAKKRERRRLKAPESDYRDAEGNVLTLRGSLTPASRREYAETLAGSPLSREDAWQRATELLFERLAVRWEIAGAPITRQRELLARLRAASSVERTWVRDALREHCAAHFPDVQAP
jgi:hypothetical protein